MKNLVDNYVGVLKKYVVFDGRASRGEFWWFYLANVAIGFVLGLVRLGFLSNIYSLAILVPSIAVGFRRLHDTGKSGAWYFIPLIPFGASLLIGIIMIAGSLAGGIAGSSSAALIAGTGVGGLIMIAGGLASGIWAIVLLAKPGDEGDNKYGPVPAPVDVSATPPAAPPAE